MVPLFDNQGRRWVLLMSACGWNGWLPVDEVESEEFGDNWKMTFSIRKPTYGLDLLSQKAKSLNVEIELTAAG